MYFHDLSAFFLFFFFLILCRSFFTRRPNVVSCRVGSMLEVLVCLFYRFVFLRFALGPGAWGFEKDKGGVRRLIGMYSLLWLVLSLAYVGAYLLFT